MEEEEKKNLQNPNLKRYMARVTGSGAWSEYSGRGMADSSAYAGGTSARLCVRSSWRLSCVRKVEPKKSSKGSRDPDTVRVVWVTTGDGAAMYCWDSELTVEVEAVAFVRVADMVILRCNEGC